MARIAPFRGLRYNKKKIATMEDVVSPPYDVIDEHSRQALFKKNPYNMVQLDLVKSVDAGAMSDERYQQARQTFDLWQQENVLARDSQPTLYLYHTEYSVPSGKRFTRKGLIALAGLAEFAEGVVKPHEKTFRGVTTDRLRLIDACQAQFSSIFSLYSDPAGEIMAILDAVCPEAPLSSVSDHDGCRHTIWAITDETAIKAVCAQFASKSLYIADGHHRYTTALQLREMMRERQGSVPTDSPYNHTMMYLCGMEDEGLSVLPTHRVVRVPYLTTVDALIEKMRGGFEVEEIHGGSREFLVSEVLGRMDENIQDTMFGLYHPGADRCFLLTLKPGVMAQTCSGKQPEALQDLDVVVLSELVLGCLLELPYQRCEDESLIHYYPDPDEALDAAVKETLDGRQGSPVLFLMNSTLVSQVKRVADEGLVMPHKSTYFYPKVLTGLVINPLDPAEKIG
ncbi:MAG: DUF1015 domain-containing protein [Proteobacteria bacterium]|nr:DUF1015 domain-containing protein [Desulfobulbaceae bacterium]MBU4151748.1 DUF1015 domain-containing protein [Pseudomonadota bacterium]